MSEHFLTSAKAYAALLGAIVTGLLGTVAPASQTWQILTYVAAVLTAVVTFVVPNAPATPGEFKTGADLSGR